MDELGNIKRRVYERIKNEAKTKEEKEVLQLLLVDDYSLKSQEDRDLVKLLLEIGKQGNFGMVRRVLNFKRFL